MKLVIHSAHAEAIQLRQTEMQQLHLHFSVLRQEEKRSTDAILKAAGFDPAKFTEYKLVKDGDAWALELTEAPKVEESPTPQILPPSDQPEKRVNGVA